MAAGLGSTQRGRGRGRGPQGQSAKAFGAKMNPGQGPTRPPMPGGRGKRGGQGAGKIGLGGAGLAGPGGRQLAARVSSGAITSQQAQKTMSQRQTLAKALGPNWRDKLSVGGKSFAQVNAGLKKNPDNAKLAALRKKLVANRSSVLESARSRGKKKGGGVPGESED